MKTALLLSLLLTGSVGVGSADTWAGGPSVAADVALASAGTGSAAVQVVSASTSIRYVFPVRPTGKVRFGHVHHHYPATDLFAPCGSEYRAVTAGVVTYLSRTDRYRPRHDDPALRGGISIAFVAADGVRYYGSHLRRLQRGLRVGTRVQRGQLLGRVGDTGDAKGKGCHVHFGISPAKCATRADDWWNRRGVLYPWPYLESWRRGGNRSPQRAMRIWYRHNGCPPHTPGTY